MGAPVPLKPLPGIKRDGTRFEGDNYVDGQWCRFQRGLPRKMGGYKAIMKYLTELSRGFTNFPQSNSLYCHSGSATLLERWIIDRSLNSSVVTDRTPVSLVADDANQWMFCNQYDPSGSTNYLLAHVAPNNDDVVNSTNGQIFYGSVTGTAALAEITQRVGANASGGIVVLHPYLVYYGTDGVIGWSVAGDPTDMSGAGSGISRPWSQKIIKGLPLRAGFGSAPAGIFIAYDAVIRMSFVGGSEVFQFDTLATDTSVMSANSVIDYDGIIYWAGVDRFMMFNGVVREVPNALNLNWFFDHIKPVNRSKVFTVKNPHWGEIWWCYPRDDAVECTHAVIYNVRENTWYDTELPASGRCAGQFSNFTGAPIMMAVEPDSSGGFTTWIHEFGVDENDGSAVKAIPSYFETPDLSSLLQGDNSHIQIDMIEPDFVQSGPMSATVTGRINARAPEVSSTPITFPATAVMSYEQVVLQKTNRRELRVKFESNCVGGDYQMGQILVHLGQGDGTVMG